MNKHYATWKTFWKYSDCEWSNWILFDSFFYSKIGMTYKGLIIIMHEIQTLNFCLYTLYIIQGSNIINVYLSKMKENIYLMPGWVAWHPVEMLVRTLCFSLTLGWNAGRMFAEYWGECSWGGPIKSVSNKCVYEHNWLFLWQRTYCIWVWTLVFGCVYGYILHVPWWNARTRIYAVCAPACSGLSPNLSVCSTTWDVTAVSL